MLFLIEPINLPTLNSVCIDKGCYLRKCKLCRTLL